MKRIATIGYQSHSFIVMSGLEDVFDMEAAKKHPFDIRVDSVGKKATITLSGYITPFDMGDKAFSASGFLDKFNDALKNHDEVHINLVNLYGGSIFEGLPIYNAIKESDKTWIHMEGLVASMGAIIGVAAPIERTSIAKYSRMMTHEAKAGIYGTATEMRDHADMTESVEGDLVDILAERTGLTAEKARAKFLTPGKDVYWKADEAVKAGLAGEVKGKASLKNEVPDNVIKHSNFMAVAALYNKQMQPTNIDKSQQNGMKELKQLVAVFNLALPKDKKLASDADESQVIGAATELTNEVNSLKSENDTLKERVTTLENEAKAEVEKKAKDLVASALKAGKIPEDQVESWEKMAVDNYDTIKASLDAIQPHKSASDQLRGGGGGAPAAKGDKYADKDFSWLTKNAPSYLENLKKDNPERFNELKDEYINGK